ncbi:hydroxymethylbilane synthase [Spirillospora sp. CA-294931]|uniref:hydroxymethylbilane synthase n=1 Tax=Spirillospora sp. CA-294931 TaxID=3240042 RepID=UPI003D8A7ADA
MTDLVPAARNDVAPTFSWSGGGGTVRLGTRTSPLAMTQARFVARRLEESANVSVEIIGIQTAGDRHQGHLGELGGKGAFLREIDRALVTEKVDLAVHCLKDVPGDVPRHEGLMFAAYMERENTSEVMLFPSTSQTQRLDDLPSGALVGTSAVRRRAQLGQIRPDLRVKYLRGNVNSRLGRLDTVKSSRPSFWPRSAWSGWVLNAQARHSTSFRPSARVSSPWTAGPTTATSSNWLGFWTTATLDGVCSLSGRCCTASGATATAP